MLERRDVLRALSGLVVPFAWQWDPDEELVPWADVAATPTPEGGRSRFTDLSQLRGAIVPVEQFFTLRHGDIPRIAPERFRLEISGEVERPEAWTLERLLALDKTEQTVCFECAGNGGVGMHGLVGNARWGGVRLRELLERATVRGAAREVVFYGADAISERLRGNAYGARFARSLPVQDALDSEREVLLAYEMNGEPLTVEHGFPLRLIVPGWYGIAQVKWLTEIEVVSRRFRGWFTAKEYVTIQGEAVGGRVVHRATAVERQRLKSIITRIGRKGGAYRVYGYAWNDGRPIERVDIHVDEALAGRATLDPPESPFAWTPFHFDWTAGANPGEHRLSSVAHDATGRQRTEEEASRYKATPWENDGQVIRRIVLPT